MTDQPWVILLSGVSGSGKTTLSAALQQALSRPDRPFIHVEADRLFPNLPPQWSAKTDRDHGSRMYIAFWEACLRFAVNGFDLIVDGILPYGNQVAWAECLQAFRRFRLCYVGVHCDLPVLERREEERADRERGFARRQYADLHVGQVYDVEVDTTHTPSEENARRIAEYIAERDDDIRLATGA